MTVRRREGATGLGDKLALIVAFGLWAPFAILSFSASNGMTPCSKVPSHSKARSSLQFTPSLSSSPSP